MGRIEILKVKETAFQTGWFIESILTELFILFIVRTHKNFFKSKPGKYLFIATIATVIVTVILPYTPLAQPLGFQPLPTEFLLLLAAIVGLYIVCAELVKKVFYQHAQY